MSKCVQNYTVYRGDTPLCSHNKVYLVSPVVLAQSQLQSWQNYHKVGSLSKSFLVSVPLFCFVSVVALVTWHQCNIIVSVPFICR